MKRITGTIETTAIFIGSTMIAAVLAVIPASPAAAAVGDQIDQIDISTLPHPGYTNHCSIGLAFDGTNLYYDRCSDPVIYIVDPLTQTEVGMFDPGIPELPNAMAFDSKRNGLWIGTQSPDVLGMPIYFWDFDDDSVTQEFTIPFDLINPATGEPFVVIQFVDGLAYNENDPASDADDEIWFSDDVWPNIGVFRPDGTLVTGFDAAAVDPRAASTSGLAVGGTNLYIGNNGGGEVIRAAITPGPSGLTFVDLFASVDERVEDMECDPVTFAPTEVMWVRSTPQGDPSNDVMTAFEIEPDTCALGGGGPSPGAVNIDIKPTSCPNPFTLGRPGALPAAILGSDTLDVADIDPTTIELSGPAGTAAPLLWSIEDVAAPDEFPQPEMRDDCGIDGPDGFDDLTLKFGAAEVGEALGAVSPGDVVIVTISAETTEGTPVSGVDIVWINAYGGPDCSAVHGKGGVAGLLWGLALLVATRRRWHGHHR